MGGKSQPQMPPPVDQSVYDKTDQAEAEAAKEKEKMLGTKRKVCTVQFLQVVKVLKMMQKLVKHF